MNSNNAMHSAVVIDTGQDIVGIFFVDNQTYVPYRGEAKFAAVRIIQNANEVVTYNGKNHDLTELGKFAGVPLGEKLLIKGKHTDMRSICWSDRIWGSSLRETYNMHFSETLNFPDTYEGSNNCDVYMTFKLWELWKNGQLMILDGHYMQSTAP